MRLYNTLTRQLEELPEPPGPVRMYFCGPTVYQRAHIGNARPFVVGMWLRAWLRARGYDATLVHNITDVNDKIYDAAPGASAQLAADATAWYLEDTGDLGLGMPDELPKATESVAGDRPLHRAARRVGPRVSGRGRRLLQRRERPGVRAPVRPAARPDGGAGAEPAEARPARLRALEGEQAGRGHLVGRRRGARGRPGWHIECSAMAEAAFGPAFEIHGGGLDLVFPHHENELAQSRALGHDFAKVWMHNGMLEFSGEKMSKSLGNDVSLRNVLDTWGREVVLLFFMTAHWRKPIDFTDATLEQAKAQWATFLNALHSQDSTSVAPEEWDRLVTILDDDFNTPEALALMHEWRRAGQYGELVEALSLFGLALPPVPAAR